MKKIFAFLLTALITAGMAHAQTFDQGTFAFNLGLGIGNSLYSGSEFEQTTPPLSLSAEYAAMDQLGLGVFVGYSGARETISWYGGTKYYYDYTYLVLALRADYHIYTTDKIDTYAGFMVGYNSASVTYGSDDGIEQSWDDPTAGGARPGVFAGGRYYFTPNIGAFAELGWGWTYLNAGLAVKIFQER